MSSQKNVTNLINGFNPLLRINPTTNINQVTLPNIVYNGPVTTSTPPTIVIGQQNLPSSNDNFRVSTSGIVENTILPPNYQFNDIVSNH